MEGRSSGVSALYAVGVDVTEARLWKNTTVKSKVIETTMMAIAVELAGSFLKRLRLVDHKATVLLGVMRAECCGL